MDDSANTTTADTHRDAPVRDEPDRTSEPLRRPIDVVSLFAGLACAVLWAAFAFGDIDSFRDVGRLVWPTVLLALGAGVLVSTARR